MGKMTQVTLCLEQSLSGSSWEGHEGVRERHKELFLLYRFSSKAQRARSELHGVCMERRGDGRKWSGMTLLCARRLGYILGLWILSFAFSTPLHMIRILVVGRVSAMKDLK